MALTETKQLTTLPAVAEQFPWRQKRRVKISEAIIRYTLLICAAVSILTTLGIIFILLQETILFFQEISIVEFLTGTRWTPLFASQHFGVLPLVNGTVLVAAGAMLIALPLGLLAAIYLSEYASMKARQVLKPLLEILAGIPTVVYGYFALLFITPLLKTLFPETQAFNAASASLVMGFMILPMVASISEDAMHAVPLALRQAAYALGATRLEVSTRI
ncbi:MAG: ABC transporter permease subunit, partial [Chloroflexota bacterium]